MPCSKPYLGEFDYNRVIEIGDRTVCVPAGYEIVDEVFTKDGDVYYDIGVGLWLEVPTKEEKFFRHVGFYKPSPVVRKGCHNQVTIE